MATINFTHVSYQIERVIIIPAGAQNGTPDTTRIIATELNHNYPANLAWRASVMFDLCENAAAADQRFARFWRFSSWNVGSSFNEARQVALIDAALADYIDEIDIDARDAEAAQAAASTPAAHPYRAETIARALAQSLYINDAMVAKSHTLRDVAADFVATYTGFNTFVQNVAVRVADTGVITIPQMRGVLNVMIREAKDAAADDQYLASIGMRRAIAGEANSVLVTCASGTRVAAVVHIDADTLRWKKYYDDAYDADQAAEAADAGAPVYLDIRSANEKTVDDAGEAPAAEDAPQDDRRLPNGTYTIILDAATDEYRTLRLADAPDHFNAAPGTQIAYYLNGADNEGDYKGFAFVVGTQPKIWKKFSGDGKIVTALRQLLASADPIEAMREYVLRSARCGVCGRKLTTPDSIRMGIGPICAGKLAEQGYTFTMPAAARAILAAVKTIEDAAPAATAPKTREEKIAAAKAAADAVNELFD